MKKPALALSKLLALAALASLPLLATSAPSRAQDDKAAPAAEQSAPAAEADQAQSNGAEDNKEPEWPCISRKVLEISPAQIWDGPSLEGLPNWRDDDTIRKLSEYVVARRIPEDEVDAAIKKYAESIPEAERDQKLTLLFSGALSRINDERKVVMSGIERFHKRQLARAKEIEKEGLTLPSQGEALPENPIPAEEVDNLTPEEEKYKWEVRVFQERQQNIPIACEIPQLIEERAGFIARSIRAQMSN
ncbi:MAG: hypothetical protein KDJ17_03355 [Hyphomicrobiaceae bacterium]|nr:hypothetical protein [Hyphomicrobiaceae bacterium]